jgi:hypothetical protein
LTIGEIATLNGTLTKIDHQIEDEPAVKPQLTLSQPRCVYRSGNDEALPAVREIEIMGTGTYQYEPGRRDYGRKIAVTGNLRGAVSKFDLTAVIIEPEQGGVALR